MSNHRACRAGVILAATALIDSHDGLAQESPVRRSRAEELWVDPAEPAQREPEPRRERRRKPKRWMFYVALSHERFTGDDFDGSRALVERVPGYAPAMVAIPKLGTGTGLTAGLGYGIYPERVGALGFWSGLSSSIEWIASSSPHSTSAPEGVMRELDIPLRVGYRVASKLLPYTQISYGFSFLTMEGLHGSVDSGGAVTSDRTSTLFVGNSFDFGIGCLFPLDESLSIDTFAGYGTYFVTNVGIHELDDALNAGVLTLRVGPTVVF